MLLSSNLVFLTTWSFTSYLAGSGDACALFSSKRNDPNQVCLTLLIMDVAFIFSLCIDRRPRLNVIQIDVIRSYALCWDSLGGGKVLLEIHFLLYWLIHCCLITVEGLLPRL